MNQPKVIIALDPGQTTGWAMYNSGIRNYSALNSWTHHDTGEMGPEPHHKRLFDFLATWHTHDFTIVCESFEYRKKERDNVVLVSKEYIGVVNYFAQDRGANVVYQTAAQAGVKNSGFWTDDKIKRVGLWSPGKRHANDAMRHLLYYQTFTLNDRTWLNRLK